MTKDIIMIKKNMMNNPGYRQRKSDIPTTGIPEKEDRKKKWNKNSQSYKRRKQSLIKDLKLQIKHHTIS